MGSQVSVSSKTNGDFCFIAVHRNNRKGGNTGGLFCKRARHHIDLPSAVQLYFEHPLLDIAKARIVSRLIISFIEAKDQMDVIEKILKHCKLWVEPEERAPPEKTVTVPFESVHVPIDEFLANF